MPAIEDVPGDRGQKPTVIIYEGKKYRFSWTQMAIFAIAAPVFIVIFYQLLEYATWIRVIVGDQTISSINFVLAPFLKGNEFSIEYRVDSLPVFTNFPDLYNHVGFGRIFFAPVDDIEIFFNIPNRGQIQFVTFCTGFQAIIIFAAIILLTPHSADPAASKGIWMRKITALFWSSAIFYVVNIVRMWIQLGIYALNPTVQWDDIHYSISAASSFIAAIIILLMHKTLPEFVISIVWTGIEIKKRFFPNLAYKTPKA
ncbi:MAG: archaeosortase H [Candidatus Sigynarchaeota archaeon]